MWGWLFMTGLYVKLDRVSRVKVDVPLFMSYRCGSIGVHMPDSSFSRFMRKSRESRLWTLADLSRAAGLSQSEVSRIESGSRLPTMRHVKGLAEAFSSSPKKGKNEPVRYESWVAHLVDLGERARIDARSGPGRWSRR